MGVAFLAGHAQIFYHVTLFAGALGLTLILRRAVSGARWGERAMVLLLVPTIAVGVAAIQLVPSWEMGVASHRAGLGFDWKTSGSLLPAYLAQALLPWGLMRVGGWQSTASEHYLYPGVLPLVLAIHALARAYRVRVDESRYVHWTPWVTGTGVYDLRGVGLEAVEAKRVGQARLERSRVGCR